MDFPYKISFSNSHNITMDRFRVWATISPNDK